MSRIPPPLLIVGGIALFVGLLMAAQALTGSGFVPAVKYCG